MGCHPFPHRHRRRAPISESPGRREIAALMIEDHFRNAASLFPILHDENGASTGFGTPGPLQYGEAAGRFSGLMPQNKPVPAKRHRLNRSCSNSAWSSSIAASIQP
jgi:hypothetical protein